MIFRLGRVKKGGAVGPGLFTILPCIDNIVTVDLRTVTFDVPPQEILTKDSVTVAVDAVVLFKIVNPMKSVINVANASHATRLLASTTLRNELGTKNLHVRNVYRTDVVISLIFLFSTRIFCPTARRSQGPC